VETHRIRTAVAIQVEAAIVDQTDVPVYLRISETAKHLRDLGMSDKAIARAWRQRQDRREGLPLRMRST
jgi:hypothetical protein